MKVVLTFSRYSSRYQSASFPRCLVVLLTRYRLAPLTGGLLASLCVALMAMSPHIGLSQEPEPAPAAIVPVEEGVHRIRVEVRNIANEWETVRYAHLDGRAGTVKIALPEGTEAANVRFSSHTQELFPIAVVDASSVFPARAGDGSPQAGRGGVFASTEDASSPDDTVEQSDIWRVEGNRLYFFNTYRGLQVYDLSDPTNPVRELTLRQPAVGEEMYVVEEDKVILLTRDARILLVDLAPEEPTVTEVAHSEAGWSYAYSGGEELSLLIGDRLYVLATESRRELIAEGPEDDMDLYVYSTVTLASVYSIVDFANPQLLTSKEFLGRGQLSLAGEALVMRLRSDSWSAGTVLTQLVTLPVEASVESLLEPIGVVNLGGTVESRFSVEVKGDILTAVIHEPRFWQTTSLSRALVASFDLANPGESIPVADNAGSPADRYAQLADSFSAPLDELLLIEDERVYGTRFDGDRLYVVTFRQVDPLWIIDLTDRATMEIVGELEIPGWSTYLLPDGDDLLAVGVEDRRVAASLFDVSDPANPTLADRVYLGSEDGYSWSEGNWDERAVTWLPERDLLLIPYVGYEPWNGLGVDIGNALALIERGDGSLTVHGSVAHREAPRRSTPLGEDVVSISGREMKIIDLSDLANPVIVSETELAWPVDALGVEENFLIQVENGYSWDAQASSTLRLTDKSDPDNLIATIDLGDDRYLGHFLEGTRLFLLVRPDTLIDQWYWWDEHPLDEGENVVHVDTYELSNDREPSFLSRETVTLPTDTVIYGQYQSDMVDDAVVWYPGVSNNDHWFIDSGFIDARWGWGYWGVQDPVIIAVEPTNSGVNVLSSTVVKSQSEHYPQWGTPIWVDDSLFLTASLSWWDDENHTYMSYYFAQVVDLSMPAAPVVSDPIDLPGTLQEVTELPSGGLVLITRGSDTVVRYIEDNVEYESFQEVQASGFDGVDAFLLDRERIGHSWSPTAFAGRFVYTFEQGDRRRSENSYELRTLEFTPEAVFTQTNSTQLDIYLYQLAVKGNRLLGSDWDTLYQSSLSDPAVPGAWNETGIVTFWSSSPHSAIEDTDGTLYFPQGPYGVDILPPLPAENRSPKAKLSSRSEEPWSTLANSEVTWSYTIADDNLGNLHERSWLFRPDGYTRSLNEAVDRGDGWLESTWFGLYQDRSFPWIWHTEHGWVYPLSDGLGGLFFWDSQLGWTWTGEVAGSFVYSFGEAAWLYYVGGSGLTGDRWFYSLSETSPGWFSTPASGL